MTTKILEAIKSDRPVKVIVHFNKRNSTKELPWTVHIRGVCIPASSVEWISCGTSMQGDPITVWKPNKSTNPRGWIECLGRVRLDDEDKVVIW